MTTTHPPSDTALIQRWRDARDARAFQALTQRYGGLVFGICHRMLRNAADAEEVTQDCFLKLALRPDAAERAVGPWLHSVAVRGALDRIRVDRRRQARDTAYGAARPATIETAAADDLLEHVDAAIDALPEDLRRCVVGHFLEGRPQEALAADLGVTTRTVRRKTQSGIARIRVQLEARGVTASLGVLAGALAAMESSALSPALGVQLGKIGIGGKASVSTAGAWTGANWAVKIGGIILMKKVSLVVAGVCVLAALYWWTWSTPPSGNIPGPEPESAALDSGAVPTDDTIVETAEVSAPPVAGSPAPADSEDATALVSEASAGSTIDAIAPIANPTKYSELAGLVADELGRPIAGASVTLLVAGIDADEGRTVQLAGYPSTNQPANLDLADRRRYDAVQRAMALPGHQFSATTDGDGRFLIGGIRYAKAGRVAAAAPGFSTEQKGVQLGEDTRHEVSITLREARPIRGRVVTPAGRAVPRARVVAVGTYTENSGAASSKSSLPRPFWTETDVRGEFVLWLADAEWASLVVDSETHGKGLFHRVHTGSDTMVTLTLDAAMATLDGRILLAAEVPAAGYFVHLSGKLTGGAAVGSENPMPAADGSQFEVRADTEGRFRIDPIPANERYTARIFDRHGAKVGEAALPALERDQVNPWIHTLKPPMRVAGRVVGKPSGDGMAGVSVRGMQDFEPGSDIPGLEMTLTGDDGSFVLEFYGDEGTYNIRASRDKHAGFSHSGPWHAQPYLRTGETETITIELPDPWSRRFVLVEPDGSPIPGASVELDQTGPGGGSRMGMRGAVTGLEGRFECEGLSGEAEVQVTFRKDGYLSAAAVSMSPRPGEDVPEEQVVMYPEAAAVVRLVDAGGLPIAGARVLCAVDYGHGNNVVREMATDAEGWAVMEGGLPAAEVEMTFRMPPPPDWKPERVMVTIGSVSEEQQLATLSNEIREADRAGTRYGVVRQFTLNRGEQNDLGELILAAGDSNG